MNTSPEHILVIKHGALGDIILATACFKAIRAHHPDAKITCLTSKTYANLLEKCPFFDEILVDLKPKYNHFRQIKRLKTLLNSKKWAWIYDLQTSNRTTLYPWLIARPWPCISNISRHTSHGFIDPDRTRNHALENLRLQLAVAGIKDVGLPDIGWLEEEVPGAWWCGASARETLACGALCAPRPGAGDAGYPPGIDRHRGGRCRARRDRGQGA